MKITWRKRKKKKINRGKRHSLLDLNSHFKFGKYEGKKVSEVNDLNYLYWIEANTNTRFTKEVFEFYKNKNNGNRK